MRAIIFDVDGVIIDVRDTYHIAIKRTAELYLKREVPLELIRDIKFSKGINNDWDVTLEVIRHFGADADYEELVEKFTDIYNSLREEEKLILDREFFLGLRNGDTSLGVVTGRPKEDLLYSLRKFRLEGLFDVIIDEDDVWNKELRKPHPFPLHLCMETLNAQEAVYIGDNRADYDMVNSYRKIYGGNVKFIHFREAIDLELPKHGSGE
jgi:HAD superfamily phosphatase